MSMFLVTGGAGFIGSNLTEKLLGLGHEVRVLDDLSSGKPENLNFTRDFDERFTFIEGSIVEPETCRLCCRDVDYVLHHAALASVPYSMEHPAETHEVDATGTLNMLVAARECGVKRFVYAASSSAYGDSPESPKTEAMTPRPGSPYAAAKLAGENYCAAFAGSYGLETVRLRYFNVFGRRQDPDSAYAAVIPLFARAILSGEEAVIYGDGGQTRDFVHVDDVVEANLRACFADRDAVSGEAFNISGGDTITIKELYDVMAALLGSTLSPRHAPPRPGDIRHSRADISKAESRLGFKPRRTVCDGLVETLQWFGEALGRPEVLAAAL